MNGLNMVEIFCGSATMSKTFSSAGYNTFSIDNRRRKGICEPTLRADVMDLKRSDIPMENVHVVFCAMPCTAFSYGAGDYYFNKNSIPKESASYFLKLLLKSCILIEKLSPVLFFIENPRGHLRYQKTMIDFLTRNNGVIKELTFSSYGFPTTKPTNIFTNAHNWKQRPMAAYGRGNKNPHDFNFNNLTVIKRQKTPQEFCNEIVSYCNNYFNVPTINSIAS